MGQGKTESGLITWSLTDWCRNYSSGVLAWPCQQIAPGHMAQFDMCVVEKPRCGFKVFVALKGLYTFLGLNSYSGQSSKWVHDTMGSWQSYMGRLGFHDCFLRSPGGERVDRALSSTTHFLPYAAVNSIGFIGILLRFTNPAPQKGG